MNANSFINQLIFDGKINKNLDNELIIKIDDLATILESYCTFKDNSEYIND